jgi:hypothetical protein
MADSYTVVTLRSAMRRPLTAVLAIWVAIGLLLIFWSHSPWVLAFALGAVIGSALLVAWLNWPRKGELVRLVLDRPRKTLYWAHRGGEPEELPFRAVRAVAVESTEHPRYAVLWAVDTTGRWVNVGQGTRAELEPFAREMAHVMEVPLWYRDRSLGEGDTGPRSQTPPAVF